MDGTTIKAATDDLGNLWIRTVEDGRLWMGELTIK
jgi:hypothetical protein